MSTFFTRRPSGLMVANESSDERAVRAELQRFDDRLTLWWEIQDGERVYRVHRVISDDRPDEYVCSWTDDYGHPLPLSRNLVEKVKSLRSGVDTMALADTSNERLRERVRADAALAIREETLYGFRSLRGDRLPVFHRSQGLRLARARARRNGTGS